MENVKNQIEFIKGAVGNMAPEDALLILNVLNGSATDEQRLVFVDKYLHLREENAELKGQQKSTHKDDSDVLRDKDAASISRTSIYLNRQSRNFTDVPHEK